MNEAIETNRAEGRREMDTTPHNLIKYRIMRINRRRTRECSDNAVASLIKWK